MKKKSVVTRPGRAAFKRGTVSIRRDHLPTIVDVLLEQYDVVAPVVRDFSIALEKIRSFDQIARGYRDVQYPARYQLEKTDEPAVFTYTNGQESPKKFLHPSRLVMFKGKLKHDGFDVTEDQGPERKLAFFGIRPCDRQSILVLDKTFITEHSDPYYLRRREGSFIATINCTRPGSVCFCASMGSGPKADRGFDLALTELEDSFLIEPGSEKGMQVLDKVPTQPADEGEIDHAIFLLEDATRHMGRYLNTVGLPQILRANLEHPHWDIMKDWCVGCTNCTIVCPTCFCYTISDKVDIGLRGFERERYWDSCFSWQFAEVHGCNFRENLRQRYRHWACHKLGYWVEQYGVFGCVGCGRCITWCPVGIDIVDVANTIQGDKR